MQSSQRPEYFFIKTPLLCPQRLRGEDSDVFPPDLNGLNIWNGWNDWNPVELDRFSASFTAENAKFAE